MSGLIAIDGNSMLFRAYYALPQMTSKLGTPTGAVFGFISMLYKLTEYAPSHMVVAFDVRQPTFRHKQYSEYKAGRRETPVELLEQFPIIKRILLAMNITVLECPGFEADDIIGTIAYRANEAGIDALIVTGDRDALQLINDNTHVLMTKKGISEVIEYDAATLFEQYGLTPARMVDLKGLMGDTSDNLPGIAGVGEKTALKLLNKYGCFEDVLTRGVTEEKGALRDKIERGADNARMSYTLGIIDTKAPVECELSECRFSVNDMSGARGIMGELQLRSLIERMPGEAKKAVNPTDEKNSAVIPTEGLTNIEVSSLEQARAVAKKLAGKPRVAIHADVDRITVCADFTTQYVFNLSDGTLMGVGLDANDVFSALSAVFSDAGSKKLVFDAKSLMHRLDALGIELSGLYFDAMIVDYLLNAVSPSNTLKDLVAERAASADAYALFMLCDSLMCELSNNGLLPLYNDIELPLITVLFDMEKTGFAIDTDMLTELGKVFRAKRDELEQTIYALAGEKFNILSPKQLGIVLFEKLGLPVPASGKTKSGYSTAADVLEALTDYPIVPAVMEYRFVSKLNSTFIDGLLALTDKTGRVHTTFNQNVTVTGRISSTEPNLQNIPVRTELGREIRRAFIASSGNTLLDADYSQIELRVLAHMSGDETMRGAFISNADIHTRTAAEVFGIPPDSVTKEQRSAAKAVNFGIVYGISDFGLAKNLGISKKQAGEYIRLYMHRYVGIADYMKNSVNAAKEQGFVSTLMGRKRPVYELKSSNFNTRSFGERIARNMPIQGTAADIIKLAMVRVYSALKERGLKAKLVLQIHDELIIDTPDDETDEVSKILESCMVSAAALSVPLVADVNMGHSWFDAK